MDRIALLFPGQGAQYEGMAKVLCSEYIEARRVFEEANDVLGYDLKGICTSGSLLELNRFEIMMAAVFATNVAIFKIYMEMVGVVPSFSAGHSLGEYSSLVAAKAVEFADALDIIKKRSQFALEACKPGSGTMSIVSGIYKNIVGDECIKASGEGSIAVIGCYNSDDQVVVSGSQDAVYRVEGSIGSMGGNFTPLMTSPPLHSPLMKSALENLENVLDKVRFSNPVFPVVSNVTSLPYKDASDISRCLVLQMIQPVQWENSINYMVEHGVDTFVEIGPKPLLTGFIDKDRYDTYVFNVREDRDTLIDKIGAGGVGGKLKRKKQQGKAPAPTVVTMCISAAVCTKNRNRDYERHFAQVISHFEKVRKMHETLAREGSQPDEIQMLEALEMLKRVFEAKQVPADEQARRMKYIFETTGTMEKFGKMGHLTK